jgi:hypothetical protein
MFLFMIVLWGVLQAASEPVGIDRLASNIGVSTEWLIVVITALLAGVSIVLVMRAKYIIKKKG